MKDSFEEILKLLDNNKLENKELLSFVSEKLELLISKYEDARTEIGVLSDLNDNLENHIKEEAQIRVKLENEIYEKQNKLDNLAGNNNYYSELIKSMELNIEQNNRYKNDFETLTEKYDKLLLANAELLEQVNTISKYKQEIEDLNDKLLEDSYEIQHNNNLIDSLNKKIIDSEFVQKELNSKSKKMIELMNEIQSLKEQISYNDSQLLLLKNTDKDLLSVRQEYEDLKQSSENELNIKDIELKNLIVENEDLKQNLNNIKLYLGQIEQEKLNLIENVNYLNKELEQNRLNISNLEETKSVNESEILDIRKRIVSLEDENTKTKEINTELGNEIEKIRIEQELKIRELESIRLEKEELAQKKIKLNYENQSLTNTLNTHQNANNKLTEDLQKLQTEKAINLETIKKLGLDNENLRSELQHQKQAINFEIEAKINSQQNEINNLNNELKQKSQLIERIIDENRIKVIQTDEITETLQARDGIILELESRITTIEAEKQEKEEKLLMNESIISNNNNTILALEDQIIKLKSEQERTENIKKQIIEITENKISYLDRELKKIRED